MIYLEHEFCVYDVVIEGSHRLYVITENGVPSKDVLALAEEFQEGGRFAGLCTDQYQVFVGDHEDFGQWLADRKKSQQ